MKRDEVLEAVEREAARMFSAVDALGEGATIVRVTEEGWTAKEVLSHSIHWIGQVAFGLGAELQPPAYVGGVEGRPSGDEWNAKAVAFYAPLSLAEVRAELERLTAALEERVRLRDDADMLRTDVIPWGKSPLWQQIGSETFLHWPGHTADLERAKAR